jgi:hypothetical protein
MDALLAAFKYHRGFPIPFVHKIFKHRMLSFLRQSVKATAPVAGYLAKPHVSSALFHPIGFRLMSSSFEKPSHPEFHRHSTRYCDSNRQILDM